eukprot:1455117-Amphidinium_carterae.1
MKAKPDDFEFGATWTVEFSRRALKGEPMVMQPPCKKGRTVVGMQSRPSTYKTAMKIEQSELQPMSGPLYLEYISDEELDDVVFMVVKTERDGNQEIRRLGSVRLHLSVRWNRSWMERVMTMTMSRKGVLLVPMGGACTTFDQPASLISGIIWNN